MRYFVKMSISCGRQKFQVQKIRNKVILANTECARPSCNKDYIQGDQKGRCQKYLLIPPK